MVKLNTVKEMVRETMVSDPKCRENDKWLILQTLRRMGFRIYVDYDELKDMPSFESITRSRRYWQNTERILLPRREVSDLRNKKQVEYKEVFK